MRKPVRALVGILVAAIVAAGCGGGDSDESSPTTTAATSGPTTTAATPPTSDPRSAREFASDKAEAERVVLRLTDLPPGGVFTGEPDTDTDSPALDAARDRFGECLDVDPSLVAGGAKGRATAESDDFEDEEGNQISNSVTVVSSRSRGAEQLAAVEKPEAPQCYEAFVNDAITESASGPDAPPDLAFGSSQVETLSLPGLNTEGVAYRAIVPVTTQGQTIDFFLDIVLALKGRTGISMTFVGIESPFLADFETELTNKVIDRAPAD